MDLDPLLVRLEALAPRFGRAREDIEAMITRGRGGDYKGVMQNCRVVLEALLRALVTDELKQTPGKAMLDELIAKFRQQGNAGVIPTNILAHMGTVQAWGNLSSHDHAAGLSDERVKVGALEGVASLNSMVAILEWYAARLDKSAPPVAVPSKGSRALPVALAVAVIAGVGGFIYSRAGEARVVPTTVDALYKRWNEPQPPPECRASGEATLLAAQANSLKALNELPEGRSAEAWYLTARAQFEQGHSAREAISRALGCPAFAAAFNLAGKIAVKEGRLSDAGPSFEAALDAAPKFYNARFNLALLQLKTGPIQKGIANLRIITHDVPTDADAHFFLGLALEGQQQAEEAKTEFCAAFAHGKAEAQARCAR